MNFDELQNIWQNSDQLKDIDTMAMINEVTKHKVNESIWEFRFNNIFELAINLLLAPFFIKFIIEHIHDTAFWIPAFILVLFGLYSIYQSTNKIKLYRQLKLKQNILEYQEILSRIKLLERKSLRSLYWVIPLLSGPLVIVITKALLGLDLYEYTNWLIMQGLGSILVAIIIVYILRKFPNREIENSLIFLHEIREYKTQK